ncbi:MAG: hypothetical protein Q8O13_07725 [Candidatus Omnitrophota bacterium]|nr:hypothetical protein [Candidatus Omnitrophota bacterium]
MVWQPDSHKAMVWLPIAKAIAKAIRRRVRLDMAKKTSRDSEIQE